MTPLDNRDISDIKEATPTQEDLLEPTHDGANAAGTIGLLDFTDDKT